MVAKRKIAFHPEKGYHALEPGTPPKTVRRNARERNRVKQIDEGFDKLKSNIPVAAAQKKLSRVKILQTAVEYIQHLHTVLTDHETVCGGVRSRTPSAINGLLNAERFAGMMMSGCSPGSPGHLAQHQVLGSSPQQQHDLMVKQEPMAVSSGGIQVDRQAGGVMSPGQVPTTSTTTTSSAELMLDQVCSPGSSGSVRAVTPPLVGNNWSPPPPTSSSCIPEQRSSLNLTSTPVNNNNSSSHQAYHQLGAAGVHNNQHNLSASVGHIPPPPALTAHYPPTTMPAQPSALHNQQQHLFQQPLPHHIPQPTHSHHFGHHLTPPSAVGGVGPYPLQNYRHHHSTTGVYPYSPPISSPHMSHSSAAPVSPFFDTSSSCSSGYFSSPSPMSGLSSPSPRHHMLNPSAHTPRSYFAGSSMDSPKVMVGADLEPPPPLMQDPTPSTTFHEEDEEILNSIIQWEKY